ncbi:MAG: riboflavin synthase [Syntrophobacterales bacterium]|nr:riboflavin synthase [Syntrophobacterales bacterium]
MFTGLVEGIGTILGVTRMAEGLRLAIAPPFPAGELTLGESVAVAGACLTVTAIRGGAFEAEVSPETLQRTTLGLKKVGERVNLERALRVGDRLGGHLVTGHVDGTGAVQERRAGPDHLFLRFLAPPPLCPFIIEKGSIAVDGVSLTVNAVQGQTFSVNIVPYTASRTTLPDLRVGDRVNLEADIIGKYVARLLAAYRPEKPGLSEEFLAEHGFL